MFESWFPDVASHHSFQADNLFVWVCVPWALAHLNIHSYLSPQIDSQLSSDSCIGRNKRAEMALCWRREKNDRKGVVPAKKWGAAVDQERDGYSAAGVYGEWDKAAAWGLGEEGFESQLDGQLESESRLRREARVEDDGRKGGFGVGRGIGVRAVPSGGNPANFRDQPYHNNPFRLGIPDLQLIPQVGSGDLAIWLSYRT